MASSKIQTPSILITGCSSGIGYHCAHQLHQRGYQVIASCKKTEDAKKLREEGLDSLVMDLKQSESIQGAFDTVMEKTKGKLDALFNNGAYGQVGAVEDLSVEVLRRQFETNVFGWHELTRLVLPQMIERGTGRILQNSSVLGFVALKYRGAYVASKFALEGLTDTLRLELHGTGVHVSLIEPGPILSEFRNNALKKFEKNIDQQSSRHREEYHKQLQRLRNKGASVSFALGPEAVYQKVLHALESPRPKVRYYVTIPTYLMGSLKKILSDKLLDYFLRSNS